MERDPRDIPHYELGSCKQAAKRQQEKEEMMASTVFSFKEFTGKWEMDDELVTVLEKEKLTTKMALLGLCETDIRDLDLKKGDGAMIRLAARELQKAHGGGPLVPDQEVQRMTPTEPKSTLLHELLESTAGSTQDHQASDGRMDLDPQVYLKKREGEKPLLIVDFISQAADCHEMEEISLGAGATLCVKTAPKIKPHQVSPAQWIAANARIMAALYDAGKLNEHSLKDYMAYTAKVGELACRFSWASVLAYDVEYRTQQAATSFRWGSDSQHLSTVILREKERNGQPQQKPTGSSPNTRKRGPGGKEICLQFNNGRCLYGPRCNYEHVCLVCTRNHAQVEHTQAVGEQSKKA